MLQRIKTSLVAVLCVFTVLFLGVNLFSQEVSQSEQEQEQDVELDDETLDKFVRASRKISSVQVDYSRKLEEAGDQEEKQKIQEEAQGKIMSALEKEGMELEKYNAVAMALKQKPKLQEKVYNRIRE